MVTSASALETLAADTWCADGETLLLRIGPTLGHVAYDIEGRRGAPRALPAGSDRPEWPLPSETVSAGRFHGDEWAHDPTIWAFVHAGTSSEVAVGCGDGLTTGGAGGWLLLTTHRLAVVSGERTRDPEDGAAGWLARAKSLARTAQEQVGVAGADTLRTVWETSRREIRAWHALSLGRTPEPLWFGQVEFVDGSSASVRMVNRDAANSVVRFGNR